jgi:hypothetical protein
MKEQDEQKGLISMITEDQIAEELKIPIVGKADDLFRIPGCIELPRIHGYDKAVKICLDSGCNVNVMAAEIYERIRGSIDPDQIVQGAPVTLALASSATATRSTGITVSAKLRIRVGDRFIVTHLISFLVVADQDEEITFGLKTLGMLGLLGHMQELLAGSKAPEEAFVGMQESEMFFPTVIKSEQLHFGVSSPEEPGQSDPGVCVTGG